MKPQLKILCIVMTVCLLLCTLAACSSSNSSTVESNNSGTAASTPETVPETEEAEAVTEPAAEKPQEPTGPLFEDVTFSAIGKLDPFYTQEVETKNDLYIFQQMEEATGVHLDWTMINFMSYTEQFNLLVAANDLPEIITADDTYNGGSQAVDEGVFYDLAPYIQEYAPNYYELIQDENVAPFVYSEEGYVTRFRIIAEQSFTPDCGTILRTDLLEALNLESPTTIDEYHDMLVAFRDHGIESPMFISSEGDTLVLSAAYGVYNGFTSNDQGELVYGPTSDSYREFLKTFSTWYKEGLINSDFYVLMNNSENVVDTLTATLSAGKTGMVYSSCTYMESVKFNDASWTLGAATAPVVNEGDEIHISEGISDRVREGWSLSTNCPEDKIPIFCQYVDFMYSDEAFILTNYGIEGVSFEYQEDGTPWYTDETIHNTNEGWSAPMAAHNYIWLGPCKTDMVKYYITPVESYSDFMEVWANADNDYRTITTAVTYSGDDASVASNLQADIDTYLDEAITKFMIGEWDVDTQWDEYIKTMESLGVNEYIDLFSGYYHSLISR